jgi:hypothetical protein
VSRDTWPVIPKPRGKVDESLLCQLPNFINIDLRKEASYALGKFLLADGQYTGKYQSNDQWGRELHYIILAKVHIDKSIGKHLTVYGDIDLTYDLGRWSNDLEKVADPHTHTHTNTNTRTHTHSHTLVVDHFPIRNSRDTDGVPGVAALLQPVDCRKAVRPERHTHTPRTHAYATRTQSARVHARSEPQNSHPVARVTSPRYLAALPRRVTWPRCDARRGRARRGTVRAEFGLS